MLKRISISAAMTVVLGLLAVPLAGPASADPPTDFWQHKPFLNMAHAGGAYEAPANTLFAFKKAVENGADQLEMDGYVTADGEFVVTHDLSPNATSNIAETAYAGMTVDEMTLAELKTLDFAHKFSPGKGHYNYDPTDPHPYRGMALADGPEPPEGYERNDFRITTFREVLETFPDTPLNIDMKAPRSNPAMATAAANVLAAIMADYPERSEDVIVASFFQGAMERFHELLPEHQALSASEDVLLPYALQGTPINPTPVALQPPDYYDYAGLTVQPVQLLRTRATRDGYAIHVWPGNGSVDGPALWQKMIDQGADGFFTDHPAALNEFLCIKRVPRPDGSARQCADTVPTALKIGPAKGKIKAGKKRTVRLTVRATAGDGPDSFRVSLRSSNKRVTLPRSVTVRLTTDAVTGVATGTTKVRLKARKNAKGKVRITAAGQSLKATSVLKVKKAKGHRR
ncbi:glycerophosphodiester phosphodiesterase family protein [Nocardioides daejeonensis]|uniref:glycerophosphodiester phosphodiesterase family protein n=1 Tax=Nocardioides daejeonensis TaxID=1046556 RepID=UPI000D750424|nr:glycerophosphodiester phosphodiesterase family protein [Nocardioides daejeonensis]